MSVNRRVTNRGAVYDVRLRTVDGSSYKRSFRTRRDAEVFEARERADRSRGTWLDPRRAEATFEDVAREWLGNNPAKRPGTLARDDGIIRVWLPAARGAGLEGLTFHDLRRANATALVLDGVDLKTAQTRLGHSDPRLTLGVYAQATSEADRAAADALGRRFLDARAVNAP
jgi:integrase